MVKNYGRSSKLLLAEKDIPDLDFNVTDTKEKGDSLETMEVLEITDVKHNWYDTTETASSENFQEIHWKVQQVKHSSEKVSKEV